jgi:tetratricopeptide (TPR) repeat protein
LDGSAGNDQAYGNTSILKAKILLLQLNSTELDETLIKIDKAYSIGVQLSPDADNYFEYGKFLIDYLGNFIGAVPVLEKADALNTDLQKRVRILNYLGMAYSATDKVKANEIHEKALSIMDTMEPLKNDDLITLKAVILYNISAEYSARFFDLATINTAISFAQRAIEQLNRLAVSTEDSKQRRSTFQILTGREYAMLNDTAHAFAYYNQALGFLKTAAINKPAIYSINLTAVYYVMAEIYYNVGQPVKAIDLLNKSVTVITPRISINSRIYLTAYEQLLTSILKNLGAMNRVPEMINYLSDLNRQLKPFVASDPKTYLLHQAWVNTDLGRLYLASKMIDSAKKYLSPAYDYYIEHLNTAQFDKDKFTTCLAQKN